MKVLIIPEDPTKDQYILKPVVERIFRELGLTARVEVLRDPHLTSINQALDSQQLSAIVNENPMIQLFLLMVDRDCENYNNTAKSQERVKEHAGRMLSCIAREEIEVWMLALHLEFRDGWKKLRKDCHPKEAYAQPFLKAKGWTLDLGGGYKRAMKSLTEQWKALLQLCPELADLAEDIRRWKFGGS